MVVKEFKSVALLDEVSVRIISERNTILGSSATACIIAKGVSIVSSQLSATFLRSHLSSVDSRIAIKNGLPK